MEISQWIAGGLLILLGSFIAVMNWAALYHNLTQKTHSSFVPSMGGLFMMIGATIMPVSGLQELSWVALVLDFGCLPLLVWAIPYCVWKAVVFLAGKMNPFKPEAEESEAE